MIWIEKCREPVALIQYRKNKFAHYEGMPKTVKEKVKDSLLIEQGFLCAYCMRRITSGNMTIEHYNCQSTISEQEALDYRIMLAVCSGNRGDKTCRTRREDMTCDAHRGNLPLTVNPQKDKDIMLIKYDGVGVIYSENTAIHKDLTETLNLNCVDMNLAENRKSALNALKTYLSRQQHMGLWKKELLEKVRNKFEDTNMHGAKQEYAGILLYYLNKQLKKYRT